MSAAPASRASERPIVWLHSHFLLPMGGTKFVWEVARRLVKHRPLTMLVERASDYWRERYAESGVPLREIGGRTSTSMLYWLALPYYLRRDRDAVVRETRQAGAIVSTFFPMNWAGNVAASRWGIRHAHLCFEPFPFFHDREVKASYPAPKRALLAYLSAVYGRIDRKGVVEADRLLTLNRPSAAAIERVYGRSDATPTYAGVDIEFFHPYSDAELADLRERHGEGPLAIHSTDFSPIKRTDLALRAFAAAQKGLPNGSAKLLVTSTRDDRNALAQMWDLARTLEIEERVEFLGFVPYEDLPRYYSLADVLIQTGTASLSGATTMSLPVKEALACGTAVIRSDATDEDVEDGVSGYLIDPANSQDTGAKLATLLGDRGRAGQMGDAGRGKIVELYRWDRVVDIVLEAVS
jgi:glycosyltransferase involved in cell wall biosynthesis